MNSSKAAAIPRHDVIIVLNLSHARISRAHERVRYNPILNNFKFQEFTYM